MHVQRSALQLCCLAASMTVTRAPAAPAHPISVFSIIQTTPSITSPRLCGGMLVAMPTAMPVEPLTSRFGNGAGNTVGSVVVSSKFGT